MHIYPAALTAEVLSDHYKAFGNSLADSGEIAPFFQLFRAYLSLIAGLEKPEYCRAASGHDSSESVLVEHR